MKKKKNNQVVILTFALIIEPLATYKYLSFESHDVALEYSKNLALKVNNLRKIDIRLYELPNKDYFFISGFGKQSPICNLTTIDDLSVLREETNEIERKLLILGFLQRYILKIVQKYAWDEIQFKVAYNKTKEKIINGNDLESFLEAMIKGGK